ncbi:endonuclease/exonuclease/phosphatase family protein [candidate division WOR-3 bacterium]|nr:endonuclease/exonuclease/phosphatase family protein [candidate division WOR-3 bacterium]
MAEQAFRLATWNLQNLGREDNPAGVYEQKLDFLAGVLERIDADVVVVNEVREPEAFRDLGDRLPGLPERHLADAPTDFRRLHTGILTRLEVQARGQWYEFPAVVPGRGGEVERAKFRRPVPWLRVRTAGGEFFLVIGVHLKSDRPELESIPESEPPRRQTVLGQALAVTGRTMESAGLRCLLDEALLRRPDEALALAGDFNDGPASDGVRLVCGVEAGLAESAEGQRLALVSATAGLPAGQEFSYQGWDRRQQLDHILVSQLLAGRVARAGIENHLLTDGPPRDRGSRPVGYPRSDHAPVWVDFGPGGAG